jgi:hypothetical protein
MEYYYQLKDKYSSILTVEGRVSHPFGKIKVYTIPVTSVNSQTASPVRLLQTVTATKNGSFKFEVDQSQLQPLERFGKITIEKADLTAPGLSWSGKVFNTIANAVYSITGLHWRVEAQESQTSVGFEPILNYIEGHAMDSSGLVLKNATVGVYLKFSQKPSYVTKTDENGYFKISSEYLPFMPYTIQYTSSNGTKGEVKTSEFLAANAEEMKTNNINPYAYKNSKGETISPKPTSANTDTGSKAGSNDNNNNKNLTEYHVLLCLDYGGRDELVRAINKLLTSGVKTVTEEDIIRFLDTEGVPDPDLVIRTSGEQRTSGFMPFQTTYSELYFTKCSFPEFGPAELKKAVESFAQRKRRFGGN